MAASKDTFEPRVFASNTFAAGAFRGVGVDVAPATPTNFPPIRGLLNSQVPMRGILNAQVPMRGRP